MFRVGARNFKDTFVEHDHAKRAQRHARRNLYLVHVVNPKSAFLFDPVLDEGVAQGMLGLTFGKIRSFDDETIFAHFVDYEA